MPARPALLVVLWPVTLAVLGACSDQAEGGICAIDNDCQGGLSCQPPPTGVSGHRCCPPDLTQATTTACKGQPVVVDASTEPPPDDGSTDQATVGAPTEGGAETGAADGATE